MAVKRLADEDITRLGDDFRSKILSGKDLIASSQGKITIELFPKGSGFDIKLTVTT